mgnify:FL=1
MIFLEAATFSLANRYALFTWNGLHADPSDSLSKYYRNILDYSNTTMPADSRQISPKYLIEYFNKNTIDKEG